MCQMASKTGRGRLMRKAPPDIVMIGEGIGTMICSTTPPINMDKVPWVLIMARIVLRI